jgi:hypothetical protein
MPKNMKIQVEYQISSYQGHALYHCILLSYPNQEHKNVKLQGQHVPGMNRNDVVAVKIEYCETFKIPQNFAKLFPNLKYLIILNSEIWNLKKRNMIVYKELEGIDNRD